MELDGRGQKTCSDPCMEVQGRIEDPICVSLDLSGEPPGGHVTLQDALVDGAEGLGAGEAHGKDAEVSLQPWVDGEAAGGGVHAGHILDVMDLLERQLGEVIPVAIVQVLVGENMGYNQNVTLNTYPHN